MIPVVGQRFGPYEILGRLGSGGMGLVFRAWDGRLHREVAVKMLQDDYKMPGMRERFLLEARAASALNHPNICTIFDIGEQDGNPYLVMELLQGETLKSRIAYGALPVEDIIRCGQEIADALSAANVKGIVHRDIKPANIFLVDLPNGKSQTKVLDFGLAKIGLSAGGGWGSRTLDLTLAGATVGTLAYMSPEQGRGESLDTRSDLFSLGIVMYEMATRQVPFKGTTSAQMFMQLFNHTPEPLRNWNESIPRHLEKVILKLLAKDRRDRFQTAKELQEALGRLSAKSNKTRWLSKTEPPPVPLVRAPDPVARQKPPVRKLTGIQREFGDEDLTPDEALPTFRPADDWPVHSMAREPVRERSPQQGTAVRPAGRYGAVAESDSSTGRYAAARSLADEAEEARRASARQMKETRVPSGARGPEYGLDDLDAYGFYVQEKAQGRGIESLLTQRMREQWVTKTAVIATALAVMMIGIFLLARGGHFRPVVLGPGDGLLLTVIQNKTGDKALDNTVMQGLEIELNEEDHLKVLGGEAYRAGLQQIQAESTDASAPVPVQSVAERVGAKVYLYGEITGSKGPYTISVEVLNANSNDKVTSLEYTAEKREQIPAAINRLAQEIRAEVSEGGWARARGSIPLEEEATGNVDALHAYSLGEAAMQSGRTHDALAAYQQAVSMDPKFAQAQMRLAWLYRAQKAEVASANAARLAQIAAGRSSDKVRLLAQFCYQINVRGDYEQAMGTIRQYVSRYPHDVNGLTALARASRLQGYLPEALLAAQQARSANSFDAEAYAEGELALIGLDRYDGALQLEAQARRMGVASSGSVLAAAYLGGKTDLLAEEVGKVQIAISTPVTQAMDVQLESYGLYLDNTGQLNAGVGLWKTAAASMGSVQSMVSAQASLLAQAALDRALVENCNPALEMAAQVKDMVRGPVASANAGLAAALCGDKTYADKMSAELQQNYSQNVAVMQYYVPELEAATDIGANEPELALQLLVGLGEYDQVSLVPYLRGMAHAAVGQSPVALFDFQTVLAHRGASFLLGSNVYPMAEIGVARAAAAGHDKAGSIDAYKKFLSLWPDADQGDLLLKEAIAKSSEPVHRR